MADRPFELQSRDEKILASIIDGTEYTDVPQSRIEYLLLELNGTLDGKADLDENGLIPTSELPPVVFEHMITVANDPARFALTTADVQNGDTVYVDSTQKMYFVIDDTKLDSEQGYQEYVAGTAAKALGDEDGNNIKQTYQPKLTVGTNLDAVPTENSTNPITSGGMYAVVGNINTVLEEVL